MEIAEGTAAEGEEVILMNAKRNRQAQKGLAGRNVSPGRAQENLTRAFLTFTQAANSLERSYSQLQSEVSRLRQELERANAELVRRLENNAHVRGYLAQVV